MRASRYRSFGLEVGSVRAFLRLLKPRDLVATVGFAAGGGAGIADLCQNRGNFQ